MELPVEEEDEEQVVRVPEALEVRATGLLPGVPGHDDECSGHDPASDTGAGGEVREEEDDEALARCGGERVGEGELGEVDHVRGDVDEGEEADTPADGLVERDVLVERNVVVERRAAEERDEVAADGQEDERDLDVQDERGTTGNRYSQRIRRNATKVSVEGTYDTSHRRSCGHPPSRHSYRSRKHRTR